MFQSLRRLSVLKNHLSYNPRWCFLSTGSPSVSVSPQVGLVDECVKIKLNGLEAKQDITIVAKVIENGVEFESRCVYTSDEEGKVDNYTSSSIAGTFLGVEPMGLFWSLKSDPPSRLIKKDVSSPVVVNIQVFDGSHTEKSLEQPALTETQVERYFKRPSVKRFPLEGRFKGTVFVPEGKGTFPALIDMYGGLVSLIETRASLLASHGYVTMALSYIGDEMMSSDFNYILDAYKWLMDQDYVDKDRLGALGLCYGGTLCLKLAAELPQIRTVVNVNGIEINGILEPDNDDVWPNKDRVFHTDEGFDITKVFDTDYPEFIPAWQHGAKILIISGEDDKQVDPKWHPSFYKQCPEEYRSNIQLYRYQGAGHMIEPPFTPHIRRIIAGRKRLRSIIFVPEKYHDTPMMAGGWTATHAHAQEDSWKKILDFLEKNMKS
ncbi:hypothetical protein ACF0H5_007908 [Mactra antiquata]